MNYQIHEIPAGAGGPTAKLSLYLWDNSEELDDGLLRPMVVICPGGGYAMTSDREGEAIALKCMTMGAHAAVLRYSVAPARFPTALLQLANAVSLIRRHAAEWYVDPRRIVVQGSSAGGHLAACLGMFWKADFLTQALGTPPELRRPNGLMLSYPVITMGPFGHRGSAENLLAEREEELRDFLSLEKQVNDDVPPVFLWHTFTDESVPVENSLLFVQALCAHRISTEFHLYPVGRHGIGTAGPLTAGRDNRGLQIECASWMDLAETWLHGLGKRP